MDIQKITSLDNARVKFVRRVRDGSDTMNMFVEGGRLSREAISADLEIKLAVVESGFIKSGKEREFLESISETADEVIEVNSTIFSNIAETRSPQGIVLICGRPPNESQTFDERVKVRMKSSMPLVVLLTEINNPSNLGAVIRTSEAAGIGGMIISSKSADPFSPKALRGAMGSAFRLPIWSNAPVPDALAWANANQFRTAGAMINGSKVYARMDWKEPRIIVFGS